jgi:hypothetical protein
MTTIWKPRGPQRPKRSFETEGASHFAFVRFLENAQKMCEARGEEDAAFRFEMAAEYFRNSYVPGKPVSMSPSVLGF